MREENKGEQQRGKSRKRGENGLKKKKVEKRTRRRKMVEKRKRKLLRGEERRGVHETIQENHRFLKGRRGREGWTKSHFVLCSKGHSWGN